MEVELLSRIQFALTAGFHFIFPPVTIGLSLFIVLVEALALKTGDEKYFAASKFFLKLFAVLFAVGVATGIIMVFQFGTNWPGFSAFVGDVFGSPLAIEAVFAFFMESTFLGVALFGWNKVGRKTHWFSVFMVCLGAHLSAVWIIVANSFMQTPAGYEIVGSAGAQKAAITDFWAMVFNPSSVDRLTHTLAASWLTGAFFAMGVCAYFILRERAEKVFAVPCMKIAVWFGAASALLMLWTGHSSAAALAVQQPEKLAAFEGHYRTQQKAPLYILGWVDEAKKSVRGIKVDGWLSKLAFGDFSREVRGLDELPPDEFLKTLHPNASTAELAALRPQYWPPVNFCFQAFRLMTYLGGAMGLIIAAGLALSIFAKTFNPKSAAVRLYLKICLPSVLLPLAASQLGWAAAEVGRQPWIVWRLMKTSDAVTTSAHAGEILFSIIAFGALFTAISAAGICVLFRKIRDGIPVSGSNA